MQSCSYLPVPLQGCTQSQTQVYFNSKWLFPAYLKAGPEEAELLVPLEGPFSNWQGPGRFLGLNSLT